MYLWVSLSEQGLIPRKESSSGPEFWIEIDSRRFWIEAICPTAGTTVDAIPKEKYGEVSEVPVDKVLLRFTHAMSTGGEIPYVVKACFPIGDLAFQIDKATGKMDGPHYVPRTEVNKTKGASVGTGLLLHPGYSCFSAVIHSTVNCTSVHCALGADFDFIRNPLAEVAIPSGAFQWARHWEFKDDTLHKIDRAPSNHLVQ
jgi:hypothetical protein